MAAKVKLSGGSPVVDLAVETDIMAMIRLEKVDHLTTAEGAILNWTIPTLGTMLGQTILVPDDQSGPDLSLSAETIEANATTGAPRINY